MANVPKTSIDDPNVYFYGTHYGSYNHIVTAQTIANQNASTLRSYGSIPIASLSGGSTSNTQPLGYGMVYGDGGSSGQSGYIQGAISQQSNPSPSSGPFSLFNQFWHHRSPQGALDFYLNSIKETDLGVWDGLKGTWAGIKYTGSHPIQAGISLNKLLSNDPRYIGYKSQVGMAMGESIVNYYGTHTIQRSAGRTAYEIATAIVGAKGVLKATKLAEAADAARVAEGAGDAAKSYIDIEKLNSKPLYRVMSKAELKSVEKTGMLRGGREGTTYFSDSKISSATKAQSRLSLPTKPEYSVEFKIVNKPKVEGGTTVDPAYNQSGGGREYFTYDKVKVEIINAQPLK